MAAVTGATELADWLLGRGRSAVTGDEAAELLGVPRQQVRVRLHQQVASHRLFSPARGLWIAIAPEYRTWGAPPALQFLDQLMVHLGRDYYVGWLSAAEVHGAAHQRPQATQVAVSRPLSEKSAGRSHVRFYMQSQAGDLPRIRHTVPTGGVWVATPELTAVDLVDRPGLGGGVSNVATVLSELADGSSLDGQQLVDVAARYSSAAVRRLGFLLETVDANVDVAPLWQLTRELPLIRPAMLDPRLPRRGMTNQRWGILVNTAVEPDL